MEKKNFLKPQELFDNLSEMRMSANEQMRLEERMYDAYSVISARHQNNNRNKIYETKSFEYWF